MSRTVEIYRHTADIGPFVGLVEAVVVAVALPRVQDAATVRTLELIRLTLRRHIYTQSTHPTRHITKGRFHLIP